MTPFCDALTVSMPVEAWADVRRALVAEIDAIGLAVEVDQDRRTLWRALDGAGIVRSEVVAGVRTVYASGGVCGALRASGRWSAYLGVLGSAPHRVTRLDATVDVHNDAPPVLDAVAQLARAGGVSFTRKAVRPRDVTSLLALRFDGMLSGTLYVGARRASVRLCLYDKRKERVDRGLPDVGPLTRYELRLTSETGVTLRDAYDPASVFWHYLPGTLLSPPPGVVPWAAGALGYDVDRPPPLSAAERLHRRLQDSAEFAALVRLASEFPGGLDYLCAHARKAGARHASPVE